MFDETVTPADVAAIVDRALFLAAGQDDLHSVEITELAYALKSLSAELACRDMQFEASAKVALELSAKNEQLRKALEDARADEMRAYGPIPISEDTAAIIEAVQTWVNQRGGEESLEQIVAMTAEAMRRASRRALEGGE